MKLEDALALFLKLDRSPKSTDQYRYILKNLLEALGPKRKIARVTADDLVEYFAELSVGRKPSTVAGYIGICKSFFAWCVQAGHIRVSPASPLRQRQAQRVERNRAIPTDELQRMVDYAKVTSPRNYAILLFLADTACRVGGLQTLTLDGLELERSRAFLVEKGAKDVAVFFGADTAEALKAWMRLRPEVRHRFVWTGQGPKYAPMSAHGLSDVIRRIAAKTGASQLWGPHSIRHAVGHAYERAGVSPVVTQKKLNHERLQTTLAHYYPDGLNAVADVSQKYPLSALHKPDAPRAVETPNLRLLKRGKS